MKTGIFKLLVILSVVGCSNEPTVVELPTPYGFPELEIPEDNPTTEEGLALGRKLYFDTALDGGGVRSCGGCHIQSEGFASQNATGVMPHLNLAWSYYFLLPAA